MRKPLTPIRIQFQDEWLFTKSGRRLVSRMGKDGVLTVSAPADAERQIAAMKRAAADLAKRSPKARKRRLEWPLVCTVELPNGQRWPVRLVDGVEVIEEDDGQRVIAWQIDAEAQEVRVTNRGHGAEAISAALGALVRNVAEHPDGAVSTHNMGTLYRDGKEVPESLAKFIGEKGGSQ